MASDSLVHSDSKHGVDTIGIHVENHEITNRESSNWIRFDHGKLAEKGSLPMPVEDPLISEKNAVDGSASHHFQGMVSLHHCMLYHIVQVIVMLRRFRVCCRCLLGPAADRQPGYRRETRGA